ncbi:saccharopine dehydrogenase NADP-binding domain-containing protein [Myxococcus sp. AM001]|uniref:saccharopine dehydrogenase NADP-binding domain-containing protein n=1 Tax=Myxococcus vastator TaxID=2709664 RepID=UPI0013CF6F10|nr:saccharopine dehydrogenase NADP-binding domain-containing protein [Myxococcus vastator]NVJ08824.1 saccharopine dehydrogenase NADP-binding domain-containing protein [Myxococcus sp. AM001]
MVSGDSVVLVGGYGVVGTWLAQVLRERHPALPLVIAGRRREPAEALAQRLGNAEAAVLDVTAPDPLASLSGRPRAVVSLVNDPDDAVLRSAVRRGVAVLDITRWTSRVKAAVLRLSGTPPQAPVLLSSAWMAGLVPRLVAGAAERVGGAERVDVGIRFAMADQAGPDSLEYMDRLGMAFDITEGGRERQVLPLTDGRRVMFSDGRPTRVFRLDTPEQATLPLVLGARTVSTRLGFDSGAVTWLLAAFQQVGLLRLLQHPRLTSVRRAMMTGSGTGGEAAWVADVEGPRGALRIEVVDPKGQAHLTAVGAALGTERLLGLDGAPPPAAGVWFPEHDARMEQTLEALRACGVQVRLEEPRRQEAA